MGLCIDLLVWRKRIHKNYIWQDCNVLVNAMVMDGLMSVFYLRTNLSKI